MKKKRKPTKADKRRRKLLRLPAKIRELRDSLTWELEIDHENVVDGPYALASDPVRRKHTIRVPIPGS